MTTKRINLRDLGKEIEGFSKLTLAEQRKCVVLGVARSIPELVNRSPVDQGLYAQSWNFTETERSMIIGNFAPHAPIIEYGARPFTPPISPLLAWAKRVLQDPSQPPEYSSAVWGLAIGTQKKIAAVGMKPKHVLTDALPAILDNIKAEFQRLY